MRNYSSTLLSAVILLLVFSAGCSIYPLSTDVVNVDVLKHRKDIPIIDPNNPPGSLTIQTEEKDGKWKFQYSVDRQIEQKKLDRIQYLKNYRFHHHAIEGTLHTLKKTPVVLDTGNPHIALVNHHHILNNKLPIYPWPAKADNLANQGLTFVRQLTIGDTVVKDLPCIYQERCTAVRFFGIPLVEDELLILGLPMLRQFDYIAFDGITKEVELSYHQRFEPGNEQQWTQYPLHIKEHKTSEQELYVTISIEGREFILKLDTGSGDGLSIREKVWNQIKDRFDTVRFKNSTSLYPYYGKLKCRKGKLPELRMANSLVKHVEIEIYPDESNLMATKDGLLGMQFFKNTVMVLDFKRNIMWLKNRNV